MANLLKELKEPTKCQGSETMTDDKIVKLVFLARKNKENGNYSEAEKQLQMCISLFENNMKKDKTPQTLVEYLTTKAEYHNLKAKVMFKDSDTPLQLRENAVESLKLMEKARNIIEEKNLPGKDDIENNILKALKNTIDVFGCIIPEAENHYVIKCPIRIKNSFRFGMSPSIIMKNPKCSICGNNPTDPEKCDHIVGVIYDGKVCRIIYDNIDIDHTALVERPKDPRCVPHRILIPKTDMEKAFTEDEIKQKERDKSQLYCHLCSELKIIPDIDFNIFILMQKLEKDDIKSSESSKEMIISGPLLFAK